jgi:hypothetical protein
MESANEEKDKYQRAKKRVEEIKGFYTHLTIYLLVNTFLLLSAAGLFRDNLTNLEVPEWGHFSTPFLWGIGLLFHGLYVFKYKTGFFKNWEERKLREFMEKDKEDLDKYNRNPFE